MLSLWCLRTSVLMQTIGMNNLFDRLCCNGTQSKLAYLGDARDGSTDHTASLQFGRQAMFEYFTENLTNTIALLRLQML